jgi:hypothetical protein
VTRPSFVIELAADARFAKDLAAGGVFVPARGFQVLDEIDLVVQGMAGEVTLHARVVYIDPNSGCGLELVGFGPAIKEQLEQLATTPAELAAVAATRQKRQRVLTSRPGLKRSPQAHDIAMIQLDDLGDTTSVVASNECEDKDQDEDEDDRDQVVERDLPVAVEPSDPEEYAASVDDRALGVRSDEPAPASDLQSYMAENDLDEERDVADGKTQRIALNAQERLRGLTLAQQIKVARGPSAAERMALERIYGKNVWEVLLHNPALTPPEVAKLARLGTLPRVLLELIVNNNTWLQIPEVRRALLANPRLGTDQVTRVLRLLPKHELKLAATIPAYPHSVRSVAKRMIDQD